MSSDRLLSRRAVLLATPALALTACAASAPADPYASTGLKDWMDSRMSQRERALTAAFVARINAERESRGLVQLIGDRSLSDVSFDHAASVFRRGVFGRITPEDRYPYERLPETVKNRYLQLGGAQLYKIHKAGALRSDQIARLGVDGWMGVHENRIFLLEPDFNRIGAGAVEGAGDAVIVVLFGQIAKLNYTT